MMPLFRPSPEDWELYRDTITDLYQTQQLTQKQLASQMKSRYGFTASRKQYLNRLHDWELRKYTNAETKDILCNKLLDDFNNGRELSYVTYTSIKNLRRHCKEKRPNADPKLLKLLQTLCAQLCKENQDEQSDNAVQLEAFPTWDESGTDQILAEWSLIDDDLKALSIQTQEATGADEYESSSELEPEGARADEDTSSGSLFDANSAPSASITSTGGSDHSAALQDLRPSLVNKFASVTGKQFPSSSLTTYRIPGGRAVALAELLDLTRSYYLSRLQVYQLVVQPRTTVAYHQSKSFWSAMKSAIYFLKVQNPNIAYPLLQTASTSIPEICKSQPLPLLRELLTTLSKVNTKILPGLRGVILQTFATLTRGLEPLKENKLLARICLGLDEDWMDDEHLTVLTCMILRAAEEALEFDDEEIFELERAKIQLLRRRGELEASEAFAQAAQRKAETQCGKDSLRARLFMSERLYILNEQGRIPEALDVAEDVIARARRFEGPKFPSEKAIYEIEDLAEAYERLERRGEAAFWLRKALQAALTVWSNREATIYINDKLEKLHQAIGHAAK